MGIQLDRIPPGHPEHNGAHDRLHRDIAVELEGFPQADLRQQRAALETWRHTFNFERPHQALGMRVPGDLYQRSPRPFPKQPEEITYPAGFLTRRVSASGYIAIEGMKVRISSVLAGWEVGLKPASSETFLVWFGPLCLGTLGLGTEAFRPAGMSPH